MAPSWEELGQLGVTAVIRTGLNYFLSREMSEERERSAAAERMEPPLRRAAAG
jgi:uncharacterized membrane protein